LIFFEKKINKAHRLKEPSVKKISLKIYKEGYRSIFSKKKILLKKDQEEFLTGTAHDCPFLPLCPPLPRRGIRAKGKGQRAKGKGQRGA